MSQGGFTSRLPALVLSLSLAVGLAPAAAAAPPPAPAPAAQSPAGVADDLLTTGHLVGLQDTSPDDSDAPSGDGASLSLWDGIGGRGAAPDDDAGPAVGPAGGGTVEIDPAVRDALAENPGGTVDVIVELAGGAEPEELREAADRAAVEASREVWSDVAAAASGGTVRLTAEARAEAAEASDRARAEVVVETLRETGADARAEVAGLLEAGRPARAAAAEGGTPVRDLWIVNSVAGPVDAELLDTLAAREDVLAIRLDETVQVPETTDGPLLPEWGLEKVAAPRTWGEYGYRGKGVTVAVLDTGVDVSHPALADRYRGRDGDHSDAWFVTTGENYPTPGDGHGHGTHVTGTIAGGPPGEVVGVAPEAEFIGVKILSDRGSGGTSGILAGMQWVLAPGGDPAKAPDIASNSWGNSAGHDTDYWEAVEAWRAAGILPVFANGNDGPFPGTVGSPGDYPHSFAVGATDRDDNVAGFSSRGPVVWDGVEYIKPQVSAPGHEIRSAWPLDSGTEYRTISGTSMATPHVSGVAALVLEANPALDVEELEEVLTGTVRVEEHMGRVPNNHYGHGIVDAYAATTRAAKSGLVTGTVTGPDGPVAATVAVAGTNLEVTADPETGAYELWVPEGTATVRVGAYGYVTVEETIEVAAGGLVELDVTLQAQAVATVSGTVTADGQPLAGAEVRVVGRAETATHTDASGAYSLEVPHGTHTLRVLATGYRPWTAQVEVAGDLDHDVTLEALPGAQTSGWPELQANPSGTGLTASGLHGPSLDRLWTAKVPAVTFGSPVLSDDTVYIASVNGTLTALDRTDGTVRWTASVGSGQRGTPVVHGDSVLVTTGDRGTLVSLSAADGSQEWSYALGGDLPTYGAPTVVDGVAYLAVGVGEVGAVHAVDADTGEGLWRTEIGGGIFFGPAVAEGLAVAASTDERTVTALDTATGEVVWTHEGDHVSLSLPAIADGRVLIGTSTPDYTSGGLLALDLATGEELWHAQGHGDTQGSSPVLYDHLAIIGSHSSGAVAAYDVATGERVWHHLVGTAVTSSTAATSSGLVLGGAQDSSVWALDATSGERLWTDTMPASVLSSTAVAEGTAVFVSSDGTVAAYTSRGTVRGTVTGPDGPVEATVALEGTDHVTTTDPETGVFELAPPVGGYDLRVSAYGLTSHTERVEVGATAPVVREITLDAVGSGSVTGTVADADGEPLPGATVSLAGTPLEPVTTGTDGTFALPDVAEGRYAVEIALAGYDTHRGDVDVTAGETTTLDVTLERFDVAVVADYQGAVAAVLRAAGLRVAEISFAEADGTADAYGVLVLNGTGDDRADADPERLARIIGQAEESGTSVVALDQWAVTYGSVEAVLRATGRDGTVRTVDADRGTVWLTDAVEHPVTAALGEGRTTLLSNGDHGWLEGYGGAALATLGTDQNGPLGTGIGYERTGYDSALVLLPSNGASPWAGPGRGWTATSDAVLVDAVRHGLDASFGAGAVTVTAGGEPADATVEVVGSFETAPVTEGSGRLLLDPGTHTVRVRAVGMLPVEREVEVVAGQDTPLEVALEPADTGAVTGAVADAATGDPVAGAQVTLVDGGTAPVTTGDDGEFALTDVPAGTHALVVTADGYLEGGADGIEVVAGQSTRVDVALDSAPRVAVVGDYQDRITAFLTEHGIPAVATGWEVTEDLSEVDVAVVNDPDTVTHAVFRQHLAAFDAAGVSVVWPAGNSSTSTSGIHLLSQVTGNPGAIVEHGGFNGPPIELHGLADHPVLAGLDEDPVTILNAGGEAPWFEDPRGIVLARVGSEGESRGPGIAYDVRTPDSVHLLLSGLGSTVRNRPDTTWSAEGGRVFLNAVRWAARPGLAPVTGTVTDPGGEPVTHAVVEVAGHGWRGEADEQGRWRLGLPDGEYTLTVSAHGYLPVERAVTVTDGAAQEVDVRLEVGDAAQLSGVVTGVDGAGAGTGGPSATAEGQPLPGATVRLLGTPLTTITDAQGRYSFPLVEAGSQELEVEAEGHVRTIHPVPMPSGAHTEDVAVLVSPTVAVVDDSDSGATAGRTTAFLEDWGYRAVDVGWTDTEEIAAADLVVVNVDGPGNDPGPDGLATLLDTANRHDVPIVWTGNYSRGGIQYLTKYHGDPEVWSGGSLDGAVTTTVVAEHPLTSGLPETFEGTEYNRYFGYFSGWQDGTVVATIASENGEHAGDAVAYRGRTSGSVDVLLSAVNNSSYGAVGTRSEPSLYLTDHSARLLANALQWAVSAEGLGADARGTVVDADGNPVEATVTVEETRRTHPARAGDGTFVAPLQPGTYTLTAEAFGYSPASVQVTVEAGQTVRPRIELPTAPGAGVSGRVTDATGAPVAGAEVVVHDTEVTVTTGADGQYVIPHLPEGEWLLSASAEGGRTRFADVTVEDGAAVTQAFRLGAPAHVAVLGDRTGTDTLTAFLTDNGFTVDTFAYASLGEVDLAGGGYDAVVLNGMGTAPPQEAFVEFLDTAAEHDVPLVFTSQWGNGTIRHLRSYTGDPETTADGFRPGQIGYLVRAEHPVLDGYEVGDTVPLLDNGTANQQYGVFSGYSGTMLADTVAPLTGEEIGGGLAYRFATPSSVHLLLGNLHVGGYGSPQGRWTVEAERIYLNGLDWAMSARQSEVHGTVTSGGEPLAGAQVSVVGGPSTETGADGGYRLGVAPGTHTVEVSAPGHRPATREVTVGAQESVRLDVELDPLPASTLTVVVTDAEDDVAVPGAQVTAEGPSSLSGTTGADGRVVLEPALVGDYEVTVSGAAHLETSVQVTVTEEPTTVEVALEPIEVAVLGDVDGDLTAWLVAADVPARETGWDEVVGELTSYEVVVVNGGEPDEARFDALLEAADEEQVSLLFTGTHGVDRGGIRLLEAHGDGVVVGGQGYRDGAVGLSAFDPDHPLFAGVTDAGHVVADDGYYSWLSEHPGEQLAALTVGGTEQGSAASLEHRTYGSGHLLLSFAAVTEYQGPGRGWTEDTGRVLLNGIDWLDELAGEPTLSVPAEVVAGSPVTVTGTAPGADTVQVLRDGDVVAEVGVVDGAWTAQVPLVEGPNELVARAVNAGGAAETDPVTVVLDTTAPTLEWLPGEGTAVLEPVVTVSGTVADEHAGVTSVTVQGEPVEVADDGTFGAEVSLDPGVNEVTVTATDAVGNEVSQTREVVHVPLTAEWETPGQGRAGPVHLYLTDPDSNPVQVEAVVLQLLQDGEVQHEFPMAYEDGRYRRVVMGVPPGTFQLRAVLTIDGAEALVDGPELRTR